MIDEIEKIYEVVIKIIGDQPTSSLIANALYEAGYTKPSTANEEDVVEAISKYLVCCCLCLNHLIHN